jgi:hypothetical protein
MSALLNSDVAALSEKQLTDKRRARLRAWCRILDAVAEMREALKHRIWREDVDDTLLEADCQTWHELSWALADFLAAKRVPR